ncbi:MAG: metallophosphoesterase [Planctomycetota bacterium]
MNLPECRVAHLDLKLPLQVAFVSDLHLFSSRSTATQQHSKIAAAIAAADVCIWGGDLFDFRWSRYSAEATIDKATVWLDQWTTPDLRRRFVFLRGNHDVHPAFEQRMLEMTQRSDRWLFYGDAVRVAGTVFVHGDVIEKDHHVDGFCRYRQQWIQMPAAPRWHHPIYDQAIRMRVHRAAAASVHGHRRVCRRLLHWLRRSDFDHTQVQRIVFGHTHRRLNGRTIDGVDFHNGGAAIRHVPFHPVTLTLEKVS